MTTPEIAMIRRRNFHGSSTRGGPGDQVAGDETFQPGKDHAGIERPVAIPGGVGTKANSGPHHASPAHCFNRQSLGAPLKKTGLGRGRVAKRHRGSV